MGHGAREPATYARAPQKACQRGYWLAPDWYLVLLSSLMAHQEKSVRVRLFPNREYPYMYSEMCDGATSTNNF